MNILTCFQGFLPPFSPGLSPGCENNNLSNRGRVDNFPFFSLLEKVQSRSFFPREGHSWSPSKFAKGHGSNSKSASSLKEEKEKERSRNRSRKAFNRSPIGATSTEGHARRFNARLERREIGGHFSLILYFAPGCHERPRRKSNLPKSHGNPPPPTPSGFFYRGERNSPA